jgi:hypothetical protein
MMRVLVMTDDRVGRVMAGSALRAWELANALAHAGHDLRLAAEPGSTAPDPSQVELIDEIDWAWPEVVVASPWSLPMAAFQGTHTLIVDGATPLLAELEAMPPSVAVRRRRRTAGSRLPLVIARARAVLVAGRAQAEWWSALFHHRPEVPILEVPFGIQEHDPPSDTGEIIGLPPLWAVVLWWGGVWPWLDLETLLAARARLGDVPVSIVVPTATRPGGALSQFSSSDLFRMAARYALSAPEVLPLEHWAPYNERHLILNRASVMAFLHRPGPEVDLSFRTRAMDAVWSATPMLLSAGGEVARLAGEREWGEVVEPGSPASVCDALRRMLEPGALDRYHDVLRDDRGLWRWSRVTEPLIEAVPRLGSVPRRALAPALIRSALTLAGISSAPGRR